jgi:hypothetical protein
MSCTLIDAITAANTDKATGGCIADNGNDVIELANNGRWMSPLASRLHHQ